MGANQQPLNSNLSKWCPNLEKLSSPPDEDLFQFGHHFAKDKSKEKLWNILGTFFALWTRSPAWHC